MSGPSRLSFSSSDASPSFHSSPTYIPSSSPLRPSSSFAPDSPLTNIDDEEYNLEESLNTQINPVPHVNSVVRIIDTKYDPTMNTTFEPSRRSSVREIFDYTEEERRRAENAISPSSLDDLDAKVPLR
jgi:hypothetical protein